MHVGPDNVGVFSDEELISMEVDLGKVRYLVGHVLRLSPQSCSMPIVMVIRT